MRNKIGVGVIVDPLDGLWIDGRTSEGHTRRYRPLARAMGGTQFFALPLK